MSHYESVFILNPALSEDQVKDVIKKYEKLLKENNCNVVEVENIDEMSSMLEGAEILGDVSEEVDFWRSDEKLKRHG